MADKAEEAAAARARELVAESVEGMDDEAEQEAPSGQEAPPAQDEHEADQPRAEQPETQEEPEEEGFNLDPEIPEELRSLYEEPDFEEEASEELSAESDEDDEDEYVDPDVREERRKRLAAEKRAQYLEGLRVQDQRKKWEAEAVKYTPLSEPFLSDIKSTSRRAFLRDAKKLHDRAKPKVEAYLRAEREKLRAELRSDAAKAWGKPTVGAGEVPSEARKALESIEEAKARGAPLHEIIKLRAEAGLNL